MACCGSPSGAEPFCHDGLRYDESMAITGESATSSSSSSEDSEEQRLQTTYARKTPLFRAIEHQHWENVLLFLQTGKWNRNLFQHSLEHMKASSPEVQCRTWVKNKTLNQLPLHLAIVHGAPSVVVQHMVDTYPDAVKSFDSDDRLPIHLAFSSAATDAVLLCLLRAWPESILVNPKPYECGDGLRSEIIRISIQEIEAAVRKNHEGGWRRLVAEADVDLNDMSDLKTVLEQLIADRRQLQDMKIKLKGQFPRRAQESQQIIPVEPQETQPQKSHSSWSRRRFGRHQEAAAKK